MARWRVAGPREILSFVRGRETPTCLRVREGLHRCLDLGLLLVVELDEGQPDVFAVEAVEREHVLYWRRRRCGEDRFAR